MKKQITSFLLAYIALFIYPTNSKPSSVAAAFPIGNETDRLALLAFKDRITQDPLNLTASWNTSTHFCKWQGVSCSTRHPGRVTILNLEGKKLTGSLPPHFGNLIFLRGINLENNGFQGIIPQEFGRLTRLKYLNLSSNAFQGDIPTNLSYCSDIQVINLRYNNLVGKIPEELSSLSTNKLKGFYVSVNGLTGSIPRWLGNVSSLLDLFMLRNYFQGTIPSELGRLLNLEHFQIGENNLSGEVLFVPYIYRLSIIDRKVAIMRMLPILLFRINNITSFYFFYLFVFACRTLGLFLHTLKLKRSYLDKWHAPTHFGVCGKLFGHLEDDEE